MVMELDNGSGNIAFAEHQNQQMVAARGNYILSGLVVTAAVGSDLENVGDDVDISTGYCFNNNTLRDLSGGSAPGSIDLSTAYSGLSSGQSRYVYIYVNTSGTVVSVAGSVATTGQQLPPDIVDKTVVLAMITLTYLDTSVDAPDIEDWQIQNPIGSAMGDNEKSYWGDDGDISVYHDNSHGYINNITGDLKFPTGKISLSSGTNINEFSIDGTLAGNSDDAVPTEKAIKTYTDLVTMHSDVSNAGSGIIITATERTAIDQLKLNGISTYVHKIGATIISSPSGTGTLNSSASSGATEAATGTPDLNFNFTPPEWLVRYAVENSKTITLTTITCNWRNHVSADYISRVTVSLGDASISSSTLIYDDATDLGNGTTGNRADVFNVTDTAIVAGEFFFINLDLSQGTSDACRIKSFDITYTIA